MFAQFERSYRRDAELSQPERLTDRVDDPSLAELFRCYGGASFEDGMYRVMTRNASSAARAFIEAAFSAFSGRASGFAYDWLGRIFALDGTRLEGGLPSVVMFTPGTGEALEAPCNLITFHENELIDYREEALAATFYKQWLAKGGSTPKHDECVGYKKPLFLGGEDTVENLELSDLVVYWGICAQLIQRTRSLPIGTRVSKISITD